MRERTLQIFAIPFVGLFFALLIPKLSYSFCSDLFGQKRGKVGDLAGEIPSTGMLLSLNQIAFRTQFDRLHAEARAQRESGREIRIFLYGPQRSGKSTLARSLKEQLEREDSSLMVAVVDLFGSNQRDAIEELARNFKDDPEFQAKIEKKDFFVEAGNFIAKTLSEEGKKLVILVDEAQAGLLKIPGLTLSLFARTDLEFGVIAAFGPADRLPLTKLSDILGALNADRYPLFEVKPETLESYQTYLRSLSREFGIRIGEEAIGLLHQYSQGWSYHLFSILTDISALNPDAREITPEMVRKYKEEIQTFEESFIRPENR